MRKILSVTLTLGVLAAAARLAAQQPPQPGPEHARLKESVGTWDATVKSMGGDSKGTYVCEMGLNGLWFTEHFKGAVAGMPFEGRGATS